MDAQNASKVRVSGRAIKTPTPAAVKVTPVRVSGASFKKAAPIAPIRLKAKKTR